MSNEEFRKHIVRCTEGSAAQPSTRQALVQLLCEVYALDEIPTNIRGCLSRLVNRLEVESLRSVTDGEGEFAGPRRLE